MKAKKFFMVAIAMMASSSAFAQFSNGSSKPVIGIAGSNEDYNRFTVSYVMGAYDFDGIKSNSNIDEPSGVSIGVTHGKSLSNTTPIFLEYGFNLTWLYGSEEEEGYKYDYEYSLNTLDH